MTDEASMPQASGPGVDDNSSSLPALPVITEQAQALLNSITGKQKAAILMLAVGQEKSAAIFKSLHEDEIRDISVAMSQLGMVKADLVEAVLADFSRNFEVSDGIVGTYETTEEYLKRVGVPSDLVEKIMEDIRGPSGRSVWEKMANMPETALANYLRNEQPQTVAVILSYLPPAYVSRVLTQFSEDFAMDVIMRILHMSSVSRDVLESLENTLRRDLVSTFGRSTKRDSYAFVAEVFNNFDRKTETTLTEILGQRNHDDMEKVNKLKFTFDDIKRLVHEDMMRVMNAINKDPDAKAKLPLALKGSSKDIKKIFLDCMSKRAGGILDDEIANIGPVRMKDAESAQIYIISIIKDLSNDGEIDISPNSSDDELIE